MRSNIIYYRKNNSEECIYYKNSTRSYPMHTHANHMMLGYVLDGAVRGYSLDKIAMMEKLQIGRKEFTQSEHR